MERMCVCFGWRVRGQAAVKSTHYTFSVHISHVYQLREVWGECLNGFERRAGGRDQVEVESSNFLVVCFTCCWERSRKELRRTGEEYRQAAH